MVDVLKSQNEFEHHQSSGISDVEYEKKNKYSFNISEDERHKSTRMKNIS
jgi:hypothetical protein